MLLSEMSDNDILQAFVDTAAALPQGKVTAILREEVLRRMRPASSNDPNGDSIERLPLTIRTLNCLCSYGVKTVTQLAECSSHELERIRSFGKTSLREVRRELEKRGLHLANEPEWGPANNKETPTNAQ